MCSKPGQRTLSEANFLFSSATRCLRTRMLLRSQDKAGNVVLGAIAAPRRHHGFHGSRDFKHLVVRHTASAGIRCYCTCTSERCRGSWTKLEHYFGLISCSYHTSARYRAAESSFHLHRLVPPDLRSRISPPKVSTPYITCMTG